MTTRPRRARRLLRLAARLAVLAGLIGLAAPAGAVAGEYTVSRACADWDLQRHPAADASAGADGCSFILRNSVQAGAPPAARGDAARWLYNAPANTRIIYASIFANLEARDGWTSAVTLDRGFRFECPTTACFSNTYAGTGGTLEYPSTQLALEVRCAASSCPRDRVYAQVNAFPGTAQITIEDLGAPGVSVTGGSIFDGWRSGTAAVSYDAGDNVGIRSAAAVVDGSPQGEQQRACDFSRKIPCPNGGGRFELDTRKFSDGAHEVSVHATDSASNLGRAAGRRALIDNTAPAAPLELSVAGGEGWRRENTFDVTWVSPKQDAAPITGLAYRLCPENSPLEQSDGCGEIQTATKLEPVDANDASKGTRVQGLKVPNAGAHQARFFLRDAAGNASETTAVARTLRYDPNPPSVVFFGQDRGDPARVRVRASDVTSGIARGEIEAQREGESIWRQLPVEPALDGFSAVLDDEVLPEGTYLLRARAVDQAGNEASSNQRDDGAVATLRLPVRLPSELRVGARGRRSCEGRGKRRRCRSKLRSRVGLNYGATTTLHGRLQASGQPVGGAAVEVWRQIKLPGAPLERIDTVQTSATGRFSLRAPEGPARLLRFRYPGTRQLRGATGDVRLRVRGATTFKPARNRVLNGGYVTVRGRVQGRPLPDTGKLVELQVYIRRQWRTFAQPRAKPSGRWEHRYRFSQIRRSTRFRFRARLRSEPGYPYATGTSRVRRIFVRGGR